MLSKYHYRLRFLLRCRRQELLSELPYALSVVRFTFRIRNIKTLNSNYDTTTFNQLLNSAREIEQSLKNVQRSMIAFNKFISEVTETPLKLKNEVPKHHCEKNNPEKVINKLK